MQFQYIHSDSDFRDVSIPQNAAFRYLSYVNGHPVQKLKDSQGVQPVSNEGAVDNLITEHLLPIVTYDNTLQALVIQPSDSLNLQDYSWLEAGKDIKLTYTCFDSDSEQVFLEATIDHAEPLKGLIYLTDSLAQGSFDPSNLSQIECPVYTCSGYTVINNQYRITCSSASNIQMMGGRKMVTYNNGAYHMNGISSTSGNYIFLNNASPGISKFWLLPGYVYVTDAGPLKNAGVFTRGFRNTVSGNDSAALGAGNVATGQAATAIGMYNVAQDAGSVVIGTYNKGQDGAGNIILGIGNQGYGNLNTVLGSSNKSFNGGAVMLGNLNEAQAASPTIIGSSNHVYAANATVIGGGNDIYGGTATAIGRNNKIGKGTVYVTVFGTGATASDSIQDSFGTFFGGGQPTKKFENVLSLRTRRRIPNPKYASNSSDPDGPYTGKLAYNLSYKGRFVPETLKVSAKAAVLDHDLYSRWELTASDSVSITLQNWFNGDCGYAVVNTSKHTLSYPSQWIVPSGTLQTWNANPGKYIMEIRKECDYVYAHPLVPFNTGSSQGTSNVKLAVALSDPDAATGTVVVRPVEVGSTFDDVSWAGPAQTAFYTFSVPSDSESAGE